MESPRRHMAPDMRRELREYAWKYFDRHADQRLKTFHFYVLLCAAALVGICAVLREPDGFGLATLLSLAISFISLVFGKLDNRTRFLTKHSEEALKFIEHQMSSDLPDEPSGAPHRCKVFAREKHEQALCGPDEWSYTTCFRWLFALFGFGGLVLAFYFGSRALDRLPAEALKEDVSIRIVEQHSGL